MGTTSVHDSRRLGTYLWWVGVEALTGGGEAVAVSEAAPLRLRSRSDAEEALGAVLARVRRRGRCSGGPCLPGRREAAGSRRGGVWWSRRGRGAAARRSPEGSTTRRSSGVRPPATHTRGRDRRAWFPGTQNYNLGGLLKWEPSRSPIGVDFLDQFPRFRLGACLGGGLKLL